MSLSKAVGLAEDYVAGIPDVRYVGNGMFYNTKFIPVHFSLGNAVYTFFLEASPEVPEISQYIDLPQERLNRGKIREGVLVETYLNVYAPGTYHVTSQPTISWIVTNYASAEVQAAANGADLRPKDLSMFPASLRDMLGVFDFSDRPHQAGDSKSLYIYRLLNV